MASLENRSVSNLIEVMADERWERLVEQQGIAYAQTKRAPSQLPFFFVAARFASRNRILRFTRG
jgi:hypothetical protein